MILLHLPCHTDTIRQAEEARICFNVKYVVYQLIVSFMFVVKQDIKAIVKANYYASWCTNLHREIMHYIDKDDITSRKYKIYRGKFKSRNYDC